jgi:hypothetical protein
MGINSNDCVTEVFPNHFCIQLLLAPETDYQKGGITSGSGGIS